MDINTLVLLIDRAISLVMVATNAMGASPRLVSDIITKRLADGGRDWTDDERAQVAADLAANKAYAQQQVGLSPNP